MATWILVRSLRRKDIASSSYRCLSENAMASFARSFCSEPVGSQYIAIDYGTTRTRVAVIVGNTVKVIQNSPSLVSITENDELIFGTQAKKLAMIDPTRVYDIKHLLGRMFDDPETQKEMKMLPYKVVKGPNGQVWVKPYEQAYNPIGLVAKTLIYSKRNAEGYLGKSVSNALIAYPSEWSAEQIGALAYAGYMARLDNQGAIMAPLAAALSHDFIKTEGRITAVVIFGGRTCDVSTQKFLVDEIRKTEAIDLTNDKSTLQKLQVAAEKAKIELSSKMETVIMLPFITTDLSDRKHLNITLTRSKFESLVKNLCERTRKPCWICLNRAGIAAKEVDEVLLVGGMARVPKLQQMVADIFGKDPTLSTTVNPDEAVAVGAAAGVYVGHLPKNFYGSHPC